MMMKQEEGKYKVNLGLKWVDDKIVEMVKSDKI
jgi:hypothetical protein